MTTRLGSAQHTLLLQVSIRAFNAYSLKLFSIHLQYNTTIIRFDFSTQNIAASTNCVGPIENTILEKSLERIIRKEVNRKGQHLFVVFMRIEQFERISNIEIDFAFRILMEINKNQFNFSGDSSQFQVEVNAVLETNSNIIPDAHVMVCAYSSNPYQM